MTRRPGTAAPLIPQRGIAADGDSKGTLHRHPDGANGTRPKNVIQLRRKYSIMAPEDLAGDPAATETQIRGEGYGATRGEEDERSRVTETRGRTGQSALLAHGM